MQSSCGLYCRHDVVLLLTMSLYTAFQVETVG